MNIADFGDAIRRLNPDAYALYRATTRDELEQAAEALIDRGVARMEAARAECGALTERGLSTALKDQLGVLVPAEAEAHSNGHVDLKLHHPEQPAWTYLVECKIWDGGAWHKKGMVQLLGSATGREGRAMVLAFFKKELRMHHLLRRLRAELDAGEGPPVTAACSDHRLGPRAFESHHTHDSGGAVVLTHLGCDLSPRTVELAEGSGEGEAG